MTYQDLMLKIKAKATLDRKKRRDSRFLETMGFLVAKGFLKTNLPIPLLPNKRLRIADAIWAGLNVEPRILEVLPAAVLRLEKHFDLDPDMHEKLAHVVHLLRRREEMGESFYDIPYDKIKVWVNFPLNDRRVKPIAKKKVIKTFRLDPEIAKKLENAAVKRGYTATKMVEILISQLDQGL